MSTPEPAPDTDRVSARPPTRLRASKTLTSHPRAASRLAAPKPANPAPTTPTPRGEDDVAFLQHDPQPEPAPAHPTTHHATTARRTIPMSFCHYKLAMAPQPAGLGKAGLLHTMEGVYKEHPREPPASA